MLSSILRYLPFLVLHLLAAGVNGQCLTVELISEQLRQRGHVVQPAVCASYQDSLSSALHGLSVYNWVNGDPGAAIEYAERAVAVQEDLYAGGEPGLPLAKSYHNRGVFYRSVGRLSAASRSLQRAVDAFRKLDHPQATRRLFNSLLEAGTVTINIGNYEKSEALLLQVLQHPQIEDYLFFRARAESYLGDLYVEWGDYEGAITHFMAARADYRSLEATAELGSVAISLAGVYYKSGSYPAATKLVEEGMARLPEGWEFDRARARSLRQLIATRTGDFLTAKQLYLQSLEESRTSGQAIVIAQALDNGAELALEEGNIELALQRVREAIQTVAPDFQPNQEVIIPSLQSLLASPYKSDLIIYLGDYARILQRAERFEEALTALDAAASVTDAIRDGLTTTTSKTFWRATVRPIYERAIELCHQTNQTERAFEFFERSRAALLLESLVEADTRSILPDSIDAQLSALEDKLAHVQRLEAENHEGTGAQRLAAVLAAQDSLVAYRSVVAQHYPRALANSQLTSYIDLATAQEHLANSAESTTALQYFIGDRRAYLYVLDRRNAQLLDLGPADSLNSQVRNFLAYFNSPGDIANDEAAFYAQSHRIYQLLVGPAPHPQNDKLLLVPDGLLSYLPFVALVSEEGEGRFLVEESTLSHAQSLSVWAYQVDRSFSQRGPVVGFAPFATSGREGAPRLTASAAEIESIEEEFTAESLLDEQATQGALIELLQTAGIAHLATHAYASYNQNQPPRILAADGALDLSDIYTLEVPAELITLNACNSNLGHDAVGEGVLSLGRAFTAAGANGVVASLWALNDQASARIIADFYQQLAQGSPKPAALRRAQLSYLRDDQLPAYLRTPYYWAALTYYGEPDRISSGTHLSWWWAIGAVLLCIILMLGVLWFARKPQAKQ